MKRHCSAIVLRCLVGLLAGCVAACTPVPPTTVTPNATLRVMAYNVKTGLGLDGRRDLSRIAEVIRAAAPDVVTLQEIDRGATRSARVDQPRALGRRLGMDHAYGPFMAFQGGEYGMAVLSRYPIRDARNLPLPEGRREPRTALAIEVETPAGVVTVVGVHLDWLADDAERFAQAEALIAHVETLDGPVVLAGDFNDEPGSRTITLLRERFVEVAKPAGERFTFPAGTPDREIDYVFLRPAAGLRGISARVIDEPVASDHRPVVAECTLRSSP
ncbi:MAG: metallophosphoesterase [Phycisphaerales bacterium]|nr:metallophosphoesterase [Phycisphaerales bacterium]